MRVIFRKIFFRDENMASVTTAKLWAVRWQSYNQIWAHADHFNGKPEMAAFTTEEDAKRFVAALSDARDLLRCKFKTPIVLEEMP